MADQALGVDAQRRDTQLGAAPRVILVNMPFAGYRQPSLALGILKAVLRPLDARVSVLDATLMFADMISPAAYDAIATWPAQDLLGDWVFATARSRSPMHTDSEYERQILAGGAPEHRIPHFGKPPVTTRLRADLREARRRVDDLLAACLDEVTRSQPDIVGFTAMFHQLSASLALAQRVKATLPDACVVMGGASCRGEMGDELLRSFPFLDVVVDGEGERALPELVRRRADRRLPAGPADPSGAVVPGETSILGREDESAATELDGLPYPDYDDYFERLERSPLSGTFLPRIPFETSRGCWWGAKRRCTFCGQASKTMAYRQKAATRALQEIEHLARKHPGCPVFITDEIAPPDSFDDFIPQLAARVPHLNIVYLEVRPSLRREQLRLLSEAGIRRLEVGIESLSDPVLTLMGKGTTALQGVQFLKWARESSLDVVWNLLWGLPGEDSLDYARMADMVPLISHLQPPNTVGAFRLDRFSPIFEDPETFGVVDVRAYPAYRYVYDLPAAALDRLAYFFTFQYREPQPVDSYTKALAGRIVEWKDRFPRSTLWYTDDGERLILADERPHIGTKELTVLSGAHRVVYLACDGVRTKKQLGELVPDAVQRSVSAMELAELLAPLVEQGLMLCDGHGYLSLGLRLADVGSGRVPARRPV